MSTTSTTMIAKTAALVAALSLVALSVFPGAPAHAQTTTTTTTTTAALQAQIQSLLAQIAALQAQIGGTVTTTFTRDLTIGSTGSDVIQLQTWLISKGYVIPAGATGYFGTQTRAAVAAFQAANGITPVAGYFGPITRTRVNAMIGIVVVPPPGTTPPPTGVTLTGNGRITDISSLGDVESDLKDGDSNQKVLGLSFDATDGDVMLQRLDVQFDIGSTGNQSSNLDRYIEEVAVYLDGKRLGTMDADDGDKDSRQWTFRFTDLNAVVRNGNEANLYVEVTPVSSIGSTETGKSVTVSIPADGLRATGADGISETYVTNSISESFTVSEATTGSLTVSAANNNPDDSQVAVDASDTTSDVTLLSFNLRAKNQDITLDELPVSFGTSDNNLNDVVSTVRLMRGSTTLRSKTVSTGTYGVVTFDNLDEVIDQDDTEEYSIVADLKSTSAYSNGTTLVASTTNNLSGWDVSDSEGNTVNPSGSAIGGSIMLTTTGITVTRVSATTQTTTGLAGAGDTTQYAVTFDVRAGDDDLYIGRGGPTRLASATTVPSASNGGINWATTTTSTFGATNNGVTNFTSSDSVTGDTAGAFKVPAGTTRRFTFNASLTATASGFTGVTLAGINYSTTSTMGTLYFTANLDTFKTNDVFMTMH